jgi:hypothetical protein
MMAAVRTAPTFHAQPPSLLFESRLPLSGENWDVMPDGQRFVTTLREEEEPEPDQIVIIPDFASELEAKFRAAER